MKNKLYSKVDLFLYYSYALVACLTPSKIRILMDNIKMVTFNPSSDPQPPSSFFPTAWASSEIFSLASSSFFEISGRFDKSVGGDAQNSKFGS